VTAVILQRANRTLISGWWRCSDHDLGSFVAVAHLLLPDWFAIPNTSKGAAVPTTVARTHPTCPWSNLHSAHLHPISLLPSHRLLLNPSRAPYLSLSLSLSKPAVVTLSGWRSLNEPSQLSVTMAIQVERPWRCQRFSSCRSVTTV
jgi:hypothetical protein